MKILRLLNNNNFSNLLLIFFLCLPAFAENEPVDIWNIDQNKIQKNKSVNNQNNQKSGENQISQSSIYDLQSQKEIDKVQMDSSINSKKVKIIGLYDPEDYNLTIDMWSSSNGDQLKYLFSNLAKLKLSKDASELMNIALLTNSYYPEVNIQESEFLKIKSDWLIKNNDSTLIEEYLIKNQVINLHPELSRYLVDQYLSESNIEKACEFFLKNTEVIENEYLSKFDLYCLVNQEKIEEAKLVFDLKKELGFKDEYFEEKLNYLFGFKDKIDLSISENSILDFHLAHITNPDFKFEPKTNTNPLIWKYLSTSNLLYDIEEIDIIEIDKISLIEKATHDKIILKMIYFLCKKFQFNINQVLNVTEAHKSLSKEASFSLSKAPIKNLT